MNKIQEAMESNTHRLIQRDPPASPRPARPLMLVVSAPSGAGKSTLCNRLVEEFPNISYSISCTTREPRGEEKDGVHYFFLSKKEFKERARNGEFLEYAKVHGNFYGTLEDTVLFAMEEGRHVLLDIDVQGAKQIRQSLAQLDPRHPIRRGFTDIFISPPSFEELERRLRGRATDKEKVIRKRLQNAKDEMAFASEYSHQIINDDLEAAYQELRNVILVATGQA
ncbi:MAG: guanylate kinase [Pontiella sp.]|nr:guanylate kinase [Pontiella sp.]